MCAAPRGSYLKLTHCLPANERAGLSRAQVVDYIGERAGTRTQDLLIKSQRASGHIAERTKSFVCYHFATQLAGTARD